VDGRNETDTMHHHFEFGGGLGDIFSQIYFYTGYRQLTWLAEDDTATVVLITHNPFARELFAWLPTAQRIEVRCLRFVQYALRTLLHPRSGEASLRLGAPGGFS